MGAKQNQSHASARQTPEAEEFERDGLEVVLPEKPQVAVAFVEIDEALEGGGVFLLSMLPVACCESTISQLPFSRFQ